MRQIVRRSAVSSMMNISQVVRDQHLKMVGDQHFIMVRDQMMTTRLPLLLLALSIDPLEGITPLIIFEDFFCSIIALTCLIVRFLLLFTFAFRLLLVLKPILAGIIYFRKPFASSIVPLTKMSYFHIPVQRVLFSVLSDSFWRRMYYPSPCFLLPSIIPWQMCSSWLICTAWVEPALQQGFLFHLQITFFVFPFYPSRVMNERITFSLSSASRQSSCQRILLDSSNYLMSTIMPSTTWRFVCSKEEWSSTFDSSREFSRSSITLLDWKILRAFLDLELSS